MFHGLRRLSHWDGGWWLISETVSLSDIGEIHVLKATSVNMAVS
jgi:hypothetical protein